MSKKVSVLGTEYEISQKTSSEDVLLETRDGYCDPSIKKIVIAEIKPEPGNKADVESLKKRIARHELMHAFMYESGLDINSEWGTDETLMDWIALQFPKIKKAFEEAGCI